jgi:homogentisate phytyltransferase/homogentisate geranylgeranyltransferase
MGFYGHALEAAFPTYLPPNTPTDTYTHTLLSLLKDYKCMSGTVFFAVFGAVIALMKDVPDIKGDKENNIRSFSVRAGAEKMFSISKRMMVSLFVCACVWAIGGSVSAWGVAGGWVGVEEVVNVLGGGGVSGWEWGVVAPFVPVVLRGCVGVLSLVAAKKVQEKAQSVAPRDGKAVYDYYMFLWRLFYLSYVALPLAR